MDERFETVPACVLDSRVAVDSVGDAEAYEGVMAEDHKVRG